MGTHSCTYKVHLLYHYADCIEQLGPMYTYSLWFVERYLKYLESFAAGTRYWEKQMVERALLSQKLQWLQHTAPTLFGVIHISVFS